MTHRTRLVFATTSLTLVSLWLACSTPQTTATQGGGAAGNAQENGGASSGGGGAVTPAASEPADAANRVSAVDASANEGATAATSADAGSAADAAVVLDAGADARPSATPRRTGGAAASSGGGSSTASASTAASSAAPAGGAAAYARACGRCHPNGEADIGPRLRNLRWTEARMRQQVRQGGGRMRPIPASRLSDADLAAAIAFMRAMNAVR